MIYLAVFAAVAGWLLLRWSRLQARNADLAALAAGMCKSEAQAEYDRCRAQLSAWLAMGASQSPPARRSGRSGHGTARASGAHVDAVAERGAWMMDRIRGLEGAQTGPAPRIRAKMELMDAAARDAQRIGKQD